jgi:hypothetical protein
MPHPDTAPFGASAAAMTACPLRLPIPAGVAGAAGAVGVQVGDAAGDPGQLRPQLRRPHHTMTSNVAGSGTAADPWILSTPPGKSDFEAWRDEEADPPALVVQVGGTQLRYQLRCIEDLHAMLKERGDWMPLGNANEQKPAAEGTVEAWGRSPGNPVGGWYGLKKGLRGRFGNYVPPVLEVLGLADVEHNARNNRMRAR